MKTVSWVHNERQRWAAGLKVRIAAYREGAESELQYPEGTVTHEFGRLHMALAGLFDAIADAIGGQDAN